jgi:hypothetical protein
MNRDALSVILILLHFFAAAMFFGTARNGLLRASKHQGCNVTPTFGEGLPEAILV